MKISSNIKIIDLALLVDNTLVFGDVHIGIEEAMNKQGILIPRFQFSIIIKRLEKILKKIKVERIVINGDLTHEFGAILDQEWRDTLKLIDFLSKYGNVIFIKGNHDTYLKPIADKRDVKIVDSVKVGDVLITHGDKIPRLSKGIKTIVIGHEHAAIGLKQGAQEEIYKCFLVGKYKGKKLIVMPSFNQVSEGTNVLRENRNGPIMPKNINNFDVYVIEDKVYHFGRIRDIL